MLRRSVPFLHTSFGSAENYDPNAPSGKKLTKFKGVSALGGEVKSSNITVVRYRDRSVGDSDVLQGRGELVKRTAKNLAVAMAKMENPVIWVWYPWRKRPEMPTPMLPTPAALKNLNGAFISDLSKRQQELHARSADGTPRSEHAALHAQDAARDAKHPFLKQILEEHGGRKAAFPFFFKRYPHRAFATEARHNVPTEMLEGTNPGIQRAFAVQNFSKREKLEREKALYRQRYARHEMDARNPAIDAAVSAVQVRDLRDHVLDNPKNYIGRRVLRKTEVRLQRALRMLRKTNFRQYWELLRDHDMMDIIQPPDNVTYRRGDYWKHDWNKGVALTTNIPDFMDPRGMNGCIETGRSRAEVARDLGLSYQRPLTESMKKAFTNQALHFARLQQMKNENPEAFRERERARFISKFTGTYMKTNYKTMVWDVPGRYRHLLGTKILRWKSKKHGPIVFRD